MSADFLTWSQFNELVLKFLPLDKKRLGVADLIPQYTRMAIADLIDYIPRYRKDQEALYYEPDFAPEGQASVGVLPPQSVLKDIYVFDINRSQRDIVIRHDWDKRFELVFGKAPCNDRKYRIAIDPHDNKFYLFPRITGAKVLSVNFDGMRLDFQDTELVCFEDDCAQAVADYVTAKIARYVERDTQRHNDFMSTFSLRRRNLYLRYRS